MAKLQNLFTTERKRSTNAKVEIHPDGLITMIGRTDAKGRYWPGQALTKIDAETAQQICDITSQAWAAIAEIPEVKAARAARQAEATEVAVGAN